MLSSNGITFTLEHNMTWLGQQTQSIGLGNELGFFNLDSILPILSCLCCLIFIFKKKNKTTISVYGYASNVMRLYLQAKLNVNTSELIHSQ